MNDGELEAKFRGLASDAINANQCDQVLAQVWALDEAPHLDSLFDSMVISPGLPALGVLGHYLRFRIDLHGFCYTPATSNCI